MTVKLHASKPQELCCIPPDDISNQMGDPQTGARQRLVVRLPPADRGRRRCYNLWQRLCCSAGADFVGTIALRVCPAEQQRERTQGDMASADAAAFPLRHVTKAKFPVYRDETGTELRLRICCQRTSKHIQLEIVLLPRPQSRD